MSFGPQDHSWLNSVAVAILGGGGFAGWMRERRKGKASESDSMLRFVKEWGEQFYKQNERIDELNRLLGQLEGKLIAIKEHNAHLVTENTALRVEITSLQTALATEQAKAAALASMPRSARSTDIDLHAHKDDRKEIQ